MPDRQPKKKQVVDKKTLPNLFILICKGWMIVAVGALAMNFTVWMFILIENLRVYHHGENYYLGNDAASYGGSPNAGYVDLTNIPKHLAGAVFAAAFDVAMMLFILVSFLSDVFLNFDIARQLLEMLFAVGLYTEKSVIDIEYFFLIANGCLKLFIVATTGAEAYTGLSSGNNSIDTPLFCVYAVMILLCSIPFTVIASMFIIQRNKVTTRRKADIEQAEKAKQSQQSKPRGRNPKSTG